MIDRMTGERERAGVPPSMPDVRADIPLSMAEAQFDVRIRSLLLGSGVVIISSAFVAAGIAWPHAAASLLRLLLATLAVVFVAGRAWHALAHVRPRRKEYTPFDGLVASRTRPAEPQALRRLGALFSAADDPEAAQRTVIPEPTRRTLRDEAMRRLADHHGLAVSELSHHGRIRALVSEPTWLLIAPGSNAVGDAAVDAYISMSQLDRILDDVETL